jgi:hypothetical protein
MNSTNQIDLINEIATSSASSRNDKKEKIRCIPSVIVSLRSNPVALASVVGACPYKDNDAMDMTGLPCPFRCALDFGLLPSP